MTESVLLSEIRHILFSVFERITDPEVVGNSSHLILLVSGSQLISEGRTGEEGTPKHLLFFLCEYNFSLFHFRPGIHKN